MISWPLYESSCGIGVGGWVVIKGWWESQGGFDSMLNCSYRKLLVLKCDIPALSCRWSLTKCCFFSFSWIFLVYFVNYISFNKNLRNLLPLRWFLFNSFKFVFILSFYRYLDRFVKLKFHPKYYLILFCFCFKFAIMFICCVGIFAFK